MTTQVAQHSSKSNEHYTPPQIVEAARATLGAIDLDPCSCALAQEVVRARQYFTAGALAHPWWYGDDPCYVQYSPKAPPARVFCNPPGGLLHPATLQPCKHGTAGAKSSLAVYWCKLWNEWQIGNVSQAIFVCFNLEVLRLTQDESLGCAPALDFPICYLRDRPRYWNAQTPPELRGKHGSPSHPGAVVYLPPKDQHISDLSSEDGKRRFRREFSPLGKVVILGGWS